MTLQSAESSQPSVPASTPLPLTIVGIAGANGSRQALETLFRNLPEDSGMAFVVVARMGRKQVNQLSAQLQQRTDMPVVTAADGMSFQPDHTYIVPAGTQATFKDGQLHLQDLTSPAQALPQGEPPHTEKEGKETQGLLDTFFRSLADEYGTATVAILLSGTGTDGLAGLQRVQEAGGFILIQDPHDAAQGALPRRAIARMGISNVGQNRAGTEQTKEGDEADHAAGKTADYIVGNMVELAQQLIQRRGALRTDAEVHVNDNTEQFDQVYQDILTEIDHQTGHDLSHYKISTLYRRIARRMQMAGIPTPTHYVNYLKSHENEAVSLFKDSLVSVTSFFRDANAYLMLERDCIPQLFAGKRRNDYIRVWVAGCATGEEAYSVAMQLMEHASQLKEPPRFQVFATDLDEDAIAFARQGLYPATIAKDISPTRLERFFTEENGSYRINTDIREHLLFAVHNLLKDPPFSRLDLICCRNVLIYFNRDAQEKVFDILHYALNSNGYLFLGSSESVDSAPELFTVIDKHCHLYQRRDVVNTPQRRLPTATPTLQGRSAVEDKRRETEAPVRTVEEVYTAWSLRTHTPARLLINDNYDITHVFGEVSRFLQDRDGPNSQNILDRVRPELRLDLQTALYPAFQKGERTISRLLNLEVGEITHLIQLHVGPVKEPGFPTNLIEVVFVIQDSAPMFSLTATDEHEHVDLALMTRMEEELMRTRERMQAVVEEYEDFSHELKTSNEELQSINEELKSTTEELETSKEELQSMNEELVTLNGELNNKIDELKRANSDLMNFIASTDVGAIFLDQQLCLSRFTPRAGELFNLIESDIRRPLAHITHRIRHTALADLAAHVSETADHIEETVQSTDNHWYILRLFPYRTVENRIDGVVITFVDISDLKRAESEERQRRQQQVLAELSRQALIGSELDALLQATTEQVAQVLGMPLCKVLELRPDNQSLFLRAGVGWQAGLVKQAVVPTDSGSQAGYTLQAQTPVVVRDLQTETRFQGPSLLTDHGVRSGISVTIYGPNGPYGVLGVHDREPRSFATYDVDFLQAVANTLAAAVTRRENMAQLQFQANILAQINDAVITIDNEQRITYLNAAAAHQYAIDATHAIGQPLSTLHTYRWLTPEAETEAFDALAAEGNWRGENVHIRHDGAEIPVESTVSVLTNQDEPIGTLAVIRDMTAQKVAEEALRRSEARLQLATTVAGLAIIEVDYATDLMHVSTEAALLFGIAAEETSVPRSVIHATFHPDDEAELWQNINACLDPEGNGEFAMEHRVVWPDGIVHWLSVRKRVFFSYPADREAHPVRALLVAIDVTERKQAEDALRRSEERYRYLFETMDEGFCVVEILVDEAGNPTDYRFLEANPAFAAFTGLENPIGRTARELVPGLEDHWVEVYANVALTGEPIRFEQGSEAMGRWFNVYAFPVGEAEQRRVAILFNNITERKRIEDALRASEAEARRNADELEAIYNTAPVGLCVMDQELRYVRINERLAEINGIPAADHIGRTGRELLPDLAGKTEEALRHILADGEAMIGVELSGEIPSQPGVQHTWIESWLPLRNQAGEVVAINIVVEDITERKRTEEALRESLARLDTILRNVPASVYMVTPDQRYIYVNRYYEQLANTTSAELQGQSIYEMFDHDTAATLAANDLHALARKSAVEVEESAPHNGEIRTYASIKVPLLGDDGEPYALLGISTDITERKQAERDQQFLLDLDAQIRLQERVDTILATTAARLGEHLQVAHCIFKELDLATDQGVALTHWRHSDELAAMTDVHQISTAMGMDMATMLATGQSVTINDTLADPRTASMTEYYRALSIQSILRVPFNLKGSLVAVLAVADEHPRHWRQDEQALLETVLARVWPLVVKARAEQALRASEAAARRNADELEAIYNTAPIGLCVMDQELRWVRINERLAAMNGYPVADHIGKTVRDLLPHLADEVEPILLRILETGEAVLNVEINGETPAEPGVQRTWVESWFPIYEQSGQIIGINIVAEEITERKRAEAQLRYQADLLENVWDAIVSTDLEFRIRSWNRGAERTYGWSAEEAIGQLVSDILATTYMDDVADPDVVLQAFLAEGGWQGEVIQPHKEGTKLFISNSTILLRDEAGNPSGAVAVNRDITAQKMAEQALAASEAKFATAFSVSPLILAITSLETGELLEVNESFLQISGYSRAEALGRTTAELGLWIDEKLRIEGLAQLRRGESIRNVEAVFRVRDGSLRYCLAGATLMEINGEPHVLNALADITEQKEFEQALQASEQQLRLITDNVSGLISYIDNTERYRFVSGTYEQWFRQPPSKIIGQHIHDNIGDTDYERVLPYVQQTLAGNRTSFESTLTYPDGNRRTVMATYVPDVDPDGTVLGFYALVTDITNRKQAEEDLRRSEEQFRAVQQTTPDGFMIFESVRDEAGTIVDFRWLYTNPAAETMLGRAHADLVGRQMLVEMPGNREDGIFDAYVRVVETGEVWQQEFHYQHEGLDHWFRTTAAKTGDGFAVAFADITANKQAEAALRASEERFRSAFEQAAVGMAHLDPDGSYVRVNDRLCEILGYTREELLQKTFMEITHPNDLEVDMAQTRRQLAGEIAHHSMEKRYIRKDGSSFWANMTASVVRDEGGDVKYGIVVIEDITARRAAEAALRELNATLEERIAERTAELERSNEDLDQFAYVASHDLKAPLRGIDSLASWINEDAGAVLPDESKGHLARLRSRIQRMEQLLEDLLTYSRVGRRDGTAEQVEIGSLIQDMVELLAAPAGFTITIEGEMPTIRTPRAPLELVFRNLIGNAVKHHEEPESGEIHISARDQGEFIEFRIADNGPGIDTVHHERIFNMFQTLRPRDQVEGSGMGLAIVQRIVELRGGTIRVESILGNGATFIFTWPKAS